MKKFKNIFVICMVFLVVLMLSNIGNIMAGYPEDCDGILDKGECKNVCGGGYCHEISGYLLACQTYDIPH